MKKTIICNIPMTESIEAVRYISDDKSIPAAEGKFYYPINAFLSKIIKAKDELKVILLVKNNSFDHYKKNTETFKKELAEANSDIGAEIEYCIINTDFKEERSVHEKLLGEIVEKIDVGSNIIVDTTYGPKDLPIVVFTALNFAEKFLNCTVDNIIYGQANFVEGTIVDSKLCDITSLFYLSSITSTINCNDPDKSKRMLNTLLNL